MNSPIEFESWKAFRNPTDLPGNIPTIESRDPNFVYYSKAQLRKELVKEQGESCMWCEIGIQINPLGCTIEHVQPQNSTTGRNRKFDYRNLGLSCYGGSRSKGAPTKLHCNAFKNDDEVTLTPYKKKCEKLIRFSLNGEIYSHCEDANQTISKLNLSIPKLNNLRRQAIATEIYLDINETQLISKEEANNRIREIKSKPGFQFSRAILDSLELINRPTNCKGIFPCISNYIKNILFYLGLRQSPY